MTTERDARHKVLLVEDHSVFREGVSAVLNNLADFHLVRSAESGAEAVKAARELKPDLILLDLHLPDISGLEVMRRLRAEGPLPAVVVLTSSNSDHTIRKALDLGAKGYLVKSGGADALAEALRSVPVGSRRACVTVPPRR